ncbi:membrane protein insertion efficiency factor YidD [Phytomonospora endophytica]|uniref:Putative membrane protein insertion efficiency factor n=1 Tax=Phytomonospora endophytica TaxID=714109 RepID=A0A841FQ71_9ACTN|nr:membrane protein insertion efficiency factor YidD [Phytomonospora endophytica]MBB6038285.1 putative membrane protein insertion efficiency factor [Phytomonospora endophytica]GIG64214.1 hypothetical protein Pen01_05090 [Phytomonospora endophytica]
MDERHKRIRTIAIAVGAPLAAIAAMVAVWLAWRPGTRPADSDGAAGDHSGNAGEHDGDAGDSDAGTGDGDAGTGSGQGCADDGGGQGCADDACDSMSTSCESTTCDTSGGCDGATCTSTGAAAAIVFPLRVAGTVGGNGRVGRAVGRAGIGAYRRWLSPRVKARCRYTPTCSVYGLAVVESHGLAAGARLALARIRRCAPSVPRGTRDEPPPPPGCR